MGLLPPETTRNERHLLDRIESLEAERDLILQGLRKSPPTISQNLAELRKLLGPLPSFQLSVYVQNDHEEWRISGVKLPYIGGNSLEDCMAQVRKWAIAN